MTNRGIKGLIILGMGGVLCCISADPISPTFINEIQTAPDSLQKIELFVEPAVFQSDYWSLHTEKIVTSKGTILCDYSWRDFQYPRIQRIPGMINKDCDTIRLYYWFDNREYEQDVLCKTNWPPENASISHVWYKDGCGMDQDHWYIDFTPTFGNGQNDDYGFIEGTIWSDEGIVFASGKNDSNATQAGPGGFFRIALGIGKYHLWYYNYSDSTTHVWPESVEVKNLDTNNINYVVDSKPPVPAVPQFSILTYQNDTRITFQLPKPMTAKVTVFDGSGRVVKVLFSGRADSQRYTLSWDGYNAQGKTMPAGIYFVTLEADKSMVTKKLVVVK